MTTIIYLDEKKGIGTLAIEMIVTIVSMILAFCGILAVSLGLIEVNTMLWFVGMLLLTNSIRQIYKGFQKPSEKMSKIDAKTLVFMGSMIGSPVLILLVASIVAHLARH